MREGGFTCYAFRVRPLTLASLDLRVPVAGQLNDWDERAISSAAACVAGVGGVGRGSTPPRSGERGLFRPLGPPEGHISDRAVTARQNLRTPR